MVRSISIFKCLKECILLMIPYLSDICRAFLHSIFFFLVLDVTLFSVRHSVLPVTNVHRIPKLGAFWSQKYRLVQIPQKLKFRHTLRAPMSDHHAIVSKVLKCWLTRYLPVSSCCWHDTLSSNAGLGSPALVGRAAPLHPSPYQDLKSILLK